MESKTEKGEEMIGFFQEDEQSKSMSRLGLFIGLIGTIIGCWAVIICWLFAKTEPNVWLALICAIPSIAGCLPYTLKVVNEIKNKALENPELATKIIAEIKK